MAKDSCVIMHNKDLASEGWLNLPTCGSELVKNSMREVELSATWQQNVIIKNEINICSG